MSACLPSPPRFECDPSLDSDQVAISGILWPGEALTEGEAFLAFGRFAAFEIQSDCDFTAFVQTSELGGWQRTHVGNASFSELDAIVGPLVDEAVASPPGAGDPVPDDSTAELAIPGQWQYGCTDCTSTEFDRSLIEASGTLHAMGTPDPVVAIELMTMSTDAAHASSVAWPFTEVPLPSPARDGEAVNLGPSDAGVAVQMWTAYAAARSAAWPEHDGAMYIDDGADTYELFLRESSVPQSP